MLSFSISFLLSSKICLDYGLILLDLIRRAICDLHSEIQNSDLVADIHDQLHIMLNQDNSHSKAADLIDYMHKMLGLCGVHACSRLIEEEKLRTSGKRPCNLKLTLRSIWKIPCKLLGALIYIEETQPFHCFGIDFPVLPGSEDIALDRLLEAIMEGALPDLEVQSHHYVLNSCQFTIQTDVLECTGYSHPAYLPCRKTCNLLAVEEYAPGGGFINTCNLIEQSRLAGSVRTDESCYKTFGDDKVDVIYSNDLLFPFS